MLETTPNLARGSVERIRVGVTVNGRHILHMPTWTLRLVLWLADNVDVLNSPTGSLEVNWKGLSVSVRRAHYEQMDATHVESIT